MGIGRGFDSGPFCFCAISAKQGFGPLRAFQKVLKMEFIYDEQSTPIALLTPELKAEFERAGLFRMLDPYYQYPQTTSEPASRVRHLALVINPPNP
ncbi:hypothetical protein MICA_682 [Micavibrio aeruginosavorus ARL-13]|uniref:Uncharacterized protein n=2 Tax=Micavibrio aeruginosavorus TaxID=349221 RepID=G2KPB5_MICAA|nr:hypothetical protein MICA_682 [Micavibrio aeruginosavorus ARL-13]